MPNRPARPDSRPSLDLWSTLDRGPTLDRPTFEADDAELIAHVDRRLGRSTSRPGVPPEPAWLVEAVEAAWPRLLQEADAGAFRA